MHLASMLQVNDSLKELELADCDLVNSHAGYCGQEIMLILREPDNQTVSDPAGHSECDRVGHRLAKQQDSPLCRYQPAAALQPPGTNAQSITLVCHTGRVEEINVVLSGGVGGALL